MGLGVSRTRSHSVGSPSPPDLSPTSSPSAVGASPIALYARGSTDRGNSPSPPAISALSFDDHGQETTTIPTVLTWNQGGGRVSVIGTWDGWQRPIPLNRSVNDFVTILELPPGLHQYAFLVDGQRVHAPDQPIAANLEGSLNNCIEVKPFSLDTDITERESPPGSYSQEIPREFCKADRKKKINRNNGRSSPLSRNRLRSFRLQTNNNANNGTNSPTTSITKNNITINQTTAVEDLAIESMGYQKVDDMMEDGTLGLFEIELEAAETGFSVSDDSESPSSPLMMMDIHRNVEEGLTTGMMLANHNGITNNDNNDQAIDNVGVDASELAIDDIETGEAWSPRFASPPLFSALPFASPSSAPSTPATSMATPLPPAYITPSLALPPTSPLPPSSSSSSSSSSSTTTTMLTPVSSPNNNTILVPPPLRLPPLQSSSIEGGTVIEFLSMKRRPPRIPIMLKEPPSVPRHLIRSVLNNTSSPPSSSSSSSSHYPHHFPPYLQHQEDDKDASVVPQPQHVVLNHLYRKTYKEENPRSTFGGGGVGAVGGGLFFWLGGERDSHHHHSNSDDMASVMGLAVTTRYRDRFVTTVFYKPKPVRKGRTLSV
ncbi:5'-AMP-activated protein kinase subunit beta-2 [Balamuthia mandrillaris]